MQGFVLFFHGGQARLTGAKATATAFQGFVPFFHDSQAQLTGAKATATALQGFVNLMARNNGEGQGHVYSLCFKVVQKYCCFIMGFFVFCMAMKVREGQKLPRLFLWPSKVVE